MSNDVSNIHFSAPKGHSSLYAEAGEGIRLTVGDEPVHSISEAKVAEALEDGEAGADRLMVEIESRTEALMHQERSVVFGWLRDWQAKHYA